jgi:hypothetical protein
VQSFSGTIARVAPPAPVVIVAQAWPSALIVAVALGFDISQVFIQSKFVKCFECLQGQPSFDVHQTDQFFHVTVESSAILIILGTKAFFKRLQCQLAGAQSIVWIFEQAFASLSHRQLSRSLASTTQWCRSNSMEAVVFPHAAYVGATNASHLVGFSMSLAPFWNGFQHPPNVQRSIRHIWNAAARCNQRICSSVPAVTAPPSSRVLKFNGDLRIEGLLCVHDPGSFVLGPSVFHPGEVIRRRLTLTELFRLFDLPLSMDAALTEACPHHSMPLHFVDAILPTILASVFRHMWGVSGGF